MTLEESSIHYRKELEKMGGIIHDGNFCLEYEIESAFIAGAKWYRENHSCCCSSCTKHNLALTNTESNDEFNDE